jgi:hypothetical protein
MGEVGGGWEFSSILYTQQLSTFHFISQIIKDDYRLPFLEIIILCLEVSIYLTGTVVGNLHNLCTQYRPHTAILHILSDSCEPDCPEYMFLKKNVWSVF